MSYIKSRNLFVLRTDVEIVKIYLYESGKNCSLPIKYLIVLIRAFIEFRQKYSIIQIKIQNSILHKNLEKNYKI